jgi:hypothetical protein
LNPEPPQRPSLTVGAREHLAAAAQGRTRRGFEDEILRLEAAIPGLGGISRDSDGRVVVYLTDPSNGAAAIQAMRARATQLNVEPGLKTQLAAGTNVVIRRGRAPFSQILDWKNTVGSAIVRLPGLVAMDADESMNQVKVTVAADAPVAKFQEAIAALNLPDSTVAIITGPRTESLAGLRSAQFRPTQGGVQIMNSLGARCTLGFNVTTYSWNETGYLTASHCDPSSIGSGGTGTSQGQPTNSGGDLVGSVFLNPAFNRTDSACLSYSLCTDADVMFVQYTNAATAAKRVTTTAFVGTSYAGGSISSVGYWNYISIVPYAYYGMTVDKVGRTTGWTRGTISGTCVDTPVAGTYMVLCANSVTGSRAGKGDSGASVFYPMVNPDPLYAMGILFGGGPMNAIDWDDGGTEYCTSGCTYYYSPWESFVGHMSRYFLPN